MRTTETILSLGSNQGDRLFWLKQAGLALLALPDTRCVALSPVYETVPVAVPEAYADLLFLNCVAILETALAPCAFSSAVHAIEDSLGRLRGDTPGLPRTIDIDILTFGDLQSAVPELLLPHPRACSRRFVLQPLADLRPNFIFPGNNMTVSDLLNTLPPTPHVRRLA